MQRIPAALRSPRPIARALPLALGLLGALSVWVPGIHAGTCTGCGNGVTEGGTYCHAEVYQCNGGNQPYYGDYTSWTRIPCNNQGYIISGCTTNFNGCCSSLNDGPLCTDGSYC